MEESKSVVVVTVLEHIVEQEYEFRSPTYSLCFGVYENKQKAEHDVWSCFEKKPYWEGYVTWMSHDEFVSLGSVYTFYMADAYFGYYREDGLLLSVYGIEYHHLSIE